MRLISVLGVAVAVSALASCGQASDGPAVTTAPAAINVAATWTLDPAASRISFASIKSGEVIETHYFPGLTGDVKPDGAATVTIPLDQVETRIALRNERMRDMFFETGQFPTATIRAAIDAADFEDLPIGGRVQTELEGTLSLHGVDVDMFADAFVTRIAASRIEVSSAEPVIVSVSDFDLDAGLAALREVAGLPSITSAAPVTFTFVFDAEAEAA